MLEMEFDGFPRHINIAGSSMMPILNPNKILTLLLSAPTNLKCGDIIVYRCPGQATGFCVHRLIFQKGDQLLAKGDNLLSFDPLVELSTVVGKVEKVIINKNGIKNIKPAKLIVICSYAEGVLSPILPTTVSLWLHKLLVRMYKKYVIW